MTSSKFFPNPASSDPKTVNSLYIHVPFCRHLCNYCDFYKRDDWDDTSFDQYEEQLSRAWDVHQEIMKKHDVQWGELETLYLGGGTPSLWGERGAHFLREFFKTRGLKISSSAEVTLEVNPGGWTESGLEAWRELGVNRFSLGVQSHDSRFLKVLDRIHSFDDVVETLGFFSKNQWNFSVDLMLGLPFSKTYRRDIQRELRELLQYKPHHLSLYILTTKPQYIHAEHLPDDEWIEKEYLEVCETLNSQGLPQYEVSNFSRPGFESQHNLQYWRSGPVAALGPSATGFFPQRRFRYKWKTTRPEVVEEHLAQDSLALERFYMQLRTTQGLWPEDYFQGKDLTEINQLIEDWKRTGLVDKGGPGGSLRLSSRGFLLLDSLMDQIFSKTNSL